MELDAAFKRSVVLYDAEGWDREIILAGLRQQINFRWRISELTAGTFLVEGPKWWKDKAIRDNQIILEEKAIHVTPWDSTIYNGLKLKSVWVRVVGFPMRYWNKIEFERLVDDFAVLLEVDQGMLECTSFREAKIRIGVTRMGAIPPERDISFKTNIDTWGWCTVQFIPELPVDKKAGGLKRRRVWIMKDGEGQSDPPKGPGMAANGARDIDLEEDEDMLENEPINGGGAGMASKDGDGTGAGEGVATCAGLAANRGMTKGANGVAVGASAGLAANGGSKCFIGSKSGVAAGASASLAANGGSKSGVAAGGTAGLESCIVKAANKGLVMQPSFLMGEDSYKGDGFALTLHEAMGKENIAE